MAIFSSRRVLSIMSSGKRFGAPSRGRGSAIVEFALVAPLFFFLMMAIMEMGILFWVNLSMQHAIREGARYAITGQSNLDSNQNPQRYRAVLQAIEAASMGIYDQINPILSTAINGGAFQSYGNPSLYTPGMFGGPGDIVVLRLDCTWPILTPLVKPFFPAGKYDFSVAATMRNEVY